MSSSLALHQLPGWRRESIALPRHFLDRLPQFPGQVKEVAHLLARGRGCRAQVAPMNVLNWYGGGMGRF
jgi:hypothetical protein